MNFAKKDVTISKYYKVQIWIRVYNRKIKDDVFMKWLAAGCAVLIIALFFEIYRELHEFRVTHYTVTSTKWAKHAAEDKVIFLSDLHEHLYGEHNKDLLTAIREEHPAAIFIGGDMPVAKKGKNNGKMGITFQNAAEFVNNLQKICPVYYANGNHEQRMKERMENHGEDYIQYCQAIEGRNLRFLENESVDLEIGGKQMRLSGLELPMESYEKFKRTEVPVSEITKRLGKCSDEAYQILLAHNPEYTESYLEWGADLILCGHLHGGLICLPNGKSVITPQFHLFPKYAGEMTKVGEQRVIVSRGLGTHTIHVRLFNPAEVIVLHMKGE